MLHRPGPLLALALVCLCACSSKGAGGAGPPKFRIVDVPAAESDLKATLAREATYARQAGLRPYLEVSANWCLPCRRLKAALGDSRVQEALAGTYIVRLEYDAWEKQFADVGIKVAHLPVFFELATNGRPTGKSIDGEAWPHDVPEEMAPVLKIFFSRP